MPPLINVVNVIKYKMHEIGKFNLWLQIYPIALKQISVYCSSMIAFNAQTYRI